MAEQLVGPLDKKMELDRYAQGVDATLLAAGNAITRDDLIKLGSVLEGINARHPLRGQETYMYGIQLLPTGVGGEYVVPPMREIAGEPSPLVNAEEGFYYGYSIAYVTDQEGTGNARVIESIKTNDSQYYDGLGNRHHVDELVHFMLEDCNVVPMYPENAHSMVTLKSDRILKEYLNIIGDDEIISAATLKRLGGLVRRVMALGPRADFERNEQRISYLNSLPLLKGLTVEASDLAIITHGDPDAITYTDPQDRFLLQPGLLLTNNGHGRTKNGYPIETKKIELQLLTRTADGVMMVPVRNVIQTRKD